VARVKVKEAGLAGSPDSLYRDWRVAQHLKGKPKIAPDDVKAALFDDFATPYAVCRPPRMGTRDATTATVAMIVMDPAGGTMDVCPLPALSRSFTRYSLHTDPVQAAA
jgi:hypothetical protein